MASRDNTTCRDGYVDFLRALGLLLLIGVHVNAPEWYKPLRSFDVPLMVFISSLCYKPLRGGYLAYGMKRFKRIYTPVFIFLTLFFIGATILHFVVGTPTFSIWQTVGSYLLLNSPSIGYVWIMRVFLLMALIIPVIDHLLQKAKYCVVVLSIFGLIIVQIILIDLISLINDKAIKFIMEEIMLYAVGYSPLAILGLKIRTFSYRNLWIFITITGLLILGYVGSNGWIFNPNKFKYPPGCLYLLYGLFSSGLLWSVKDLISPLIRSQGFTYLSRNSMWIYLWHIVPVYLITPIDWIDNTWVLRYMIVVFVAIGLYWTYSKFITLFPESLRRYLQ